MWTVVKPVPRMKYESKPHGSKDFEYHPHKVDDLATFADNYDRIFKKGKYAPAADPVHSLTPGTVSDCCCEPVSWDRVAYVCNACFKVCKPSLTKTNP